MDVRISHIKEGESILPSSQVEIDFKSSAILDM